MDVQTSCLGFVQYNRLDLLMFKCKKTFMILNWYFKESLENTYV